MKTMISLGFSCQSRYTINRCVASPATYPFDWLITTKKFLLNCFLHNGSNFCESIMQLDVYEMPVQKVQGVAGKGIYYWHDFRRNGLTLAENWRENVDKLVYKYTHLWEKLTIILRDKFIEKILIISNSQHNLNQFAQSREEFNEKFGIDEKFIADIVISLLQYGAVNFKVIVLSRNMFPYDKNIDAISGHYDLADVHFVGVLSLPTNDLVATSLLHHYNGLCLDSSRLDTITGKYHNGAKIVRDKKGNACVVYNSIGMPWAEARLFPEGYIFAFCSIVDSVFTAVYDNGKIIFSNNTSWIKKNS
ncbi:MAG: hypothetical protein WCF85_12205 [Rhodospirillaceae bacterium]